MTRPHTATCVLTIFFPLAALAQPRPVPTPKNDLPAAAAAAAEVTPSESKYSLTIYSAADPANFDPRHADGHTPGFAVVREIRKLPLVRGENTVKFTDVAAGIDPTTVSFKSLTAPDTTTILEQSYENDLITPETLLRKYVGRNIIVNRKQEPMPGDHNRMPETIEAKLLAVTDSQLVLLTNNKQLPVQMIPRNSDISEIKLFDLQTGLTTKPTLIWRLATNRAGDHDVLVSYQTDGLTWRADYNLLLDQNDTTARLSAWVTLVNSSGVTYPNVRLRLVAGDLGRIGKRPETHLRDGMVEGQAFETRPSFEYHTYTLNRTTTLANNGAKQIELFPARSGLPVTKKYVYVGARPTPGWPDQPLLTRGRVPASHRVDVYLQLANTEQGGLGIPLPAGRIRVNKRDAQGAQDEFADAPEFIGEDTLPHTPRDEQLSIHVGSAFDLVADRTETDFSASADRRTITETIEIKLRNRKTEPVTILVREPLYRWSQWEITACSEKYTKRDARTIEIPVELKAGEEKAVTYTARYTW